ncbi:MAG TPA: GAF domain-containing SpoIIE family protein phosphatase [Longimicrobiales bacterium]|nr:GAF domain-containing SpoIIE family protein phosphatase [Longimicrobiales bacterium]
MTETLLAGLTPLPSSVLQLLERYTRVRSDVEPRLWLRQEREWLCIYPETYGSVVGPQAPSRTVDQGGAGLELELCGDGDEEELEFLAASLGQIFSYEGEARSAAHELSERYEEINLLYSISEILASFLSMEEATTRILDEVADVLGARRAALWVADRATNRLVLTAAVGDEGMKGPVDIDDESSLTARVFRDQQPINLERGDRLPRGTRQEPRPQGEEPYLSVPVTYTPPDGAGRTVGVITLVGRRSDVRFSAGDLRLLTAVASQVGAALETQRLVRESLRRERIERELELAHDLQLKLLPDASHFQGTARVSARCAPAESVGGDLYNLFELSHGRLGVVIGDVSGHGFSAALIMALTMSAIAIYAQEATQPGEVLRQMHQSLIDELESTEMYLTIIYAIVDPAHGEITFANAGHPHAFVISGNGAVQRLGATSPPLGTITFPEYGEGRVAWPPEDLLVLFTDGLSDAFSGNSGINGEQQLLAEIIRIRDREPGEILDHVFGVAASGHLAVPPDDRTAVLLRS